ncbi:MAG: SulP family inorganic anion transporter [Gammaproteobacteria bacterium]|nr:SulP family inorganic anion transporter [Gammaproteobacteria bacterium]
MKLTFENKSFLKKWFKKYPFAKNDLWGSISATAVMLPQATAFGIAIWAPYSIDPATGALAGLITAISLCFFSGLSFGTTGMISSPTGPTMVLISGALFSLSSYGITGSALFTNLSMLLFVSGILQILIGISNGGKLIKFIPYPVISGFMSGSAILMITSQAHTLHVDDYEQALNLGLWIPWSTALVVFFSIIYMPRFITRLPGILSGLIIGSIYFHFMVAITNTTLPADWLVGQLPQLSSIQIFNTSNILSQINWDIILPVSFALAILSSLDSLLTSVVADVATGQRHKARRELAGQGIGQMVAALFGGVAGAGTTGATMVSINSGGRHWVSTISAFTIILIIIVLGPIASLLPLSVLAGIIFYVAIFSMLERDILSWFRRRTSRLDAFTTVLVIGVTVAYNLMIAVALGIGLAILQFVRAHIKTPVIHRRSNIEQHPSLRRRNEKERELLTKYANRIIIYELTGNLFFGTVDRLFEEMNIDLNRSAQIILDMARVQQVDLTAVKMLQQMADQLHKSNGELIFTNVRSGKGLSRKVEKTLRHISPQHAGDYPVRTFIDADEAIEYAENKLLEQLGTDTASDQYVNIEDSSLFHGLPAETISTIKRIMKPQSLNSGDYLFKTHDYGQELFVILKGEIDIQLPYSKNHYKRLSKFGPGSFFGEIAFLKPGSRTADAKIIKSADLMVLSRDDFEQLRAQFPDTAIKLLIRLGRELSDRLRWADTELRRLSN